MSSGATAQNQPWKSKEQAEEARYIREKEQSQLAAIHDQAKKDVVDKAKEETGAQAERDFEGGFGGQEDLEDRYATTSGEH
jgi:F0F1-type ATP synthase membrane subunit b/b'